MQSSFDVREWVQQCHRPVVMVATTPTVEDICGKNNLNFVQLLKPFERLDNLRVYPFKLESGPQARRVGSISLRFVSFYEVSEMDGNESDGYLRNYCQELAPDPPVQLTHLRNHMIQNQGQTINIPNSNDNDEKSSSLIRRRSTITQALRICNVKDVESFFDQNPDPTPWFSLYQRQYFETLRYSKYEFTDAPVAVMYVASTRDEDAVIKLKYLSQPENLPSKFKHGIYSSDMYETFILIHDKHDTHLRSKVKTIFQKVCKEFTDEKCKLLHINSINKDTPNMECLDLWKSFIEDKYPKPKNVIDAIKTQTTANSNSNSNSNKEEELQDSNDLQSTAKRSWTHGNNIFDKTAKNEHGGILHGMYVSEQDVTVMRQLISDFALYGIFRFVERRIRELYTIISQQRRGITNTFKKLFAARKQKPHIQQRKLQRQQSPHMESPIYELNTIESQIRQLADLCFVMQQYHVALDHYKMIESDYRSDGCKEYLAGCLEMSGLCCALLSKAMATPSWMNLREVLNNEDGNSSNNNNNNNSNSGNSSLLNDLDNHSQSNNSSNNNRREMEKYYDLAFRTYCDINDLRRGTRSCMWAWMSHCSLGHSFNNDMISNVLLRASEQQMEVRHRAAMLLEQAAFAYLRAGPQRSPMIRKYAFHLILAGHLYKECEQREHSIRCYSRAMMVYAERGWAHIEDHINYNLGWLSSKVARYDAAIDYFLELLGAGRGSQARQKSFIDKFVNIINKWPIMNDNSITSGSMSEEKNDDNNNNLSLNYYRIMNEQIGALASRSIANSLKFVPNLNIPLFDPNVNITLQHSDLLASNYIDQVWNYQEKDITAGLIKNPINFLNCISSQSSSSPPSMSNNNNNNNNNKNNNKDLKERQTIAVRGETIMVDIMVKNPLKRDLFVCNMLLHCKIICDNNDEIALLDYDELFAYSPMNVSLSAMQEKMVRLCLSPIHPILDGKVIELVGIRWQIFDCMQGFHRFDKAFESILSNSPVSMHAFLKQGPKNVTYFNKDHRSIEHYLKDDMKNESLFYQIDSPKPYVICEFDNCNFYFPHTIYSGELVPVVLTCVNVSDTQTAYDCVLRINRASFVSISKLDDQFIQLYQRYKNLKKIQKENEKADNNNGNNNNNNKNEQLNDSNKQSLKNERDLIFSQLRDWIDNINILNLQENVRPVDDMLDTMHLNDKKKKQNEKKSKSYMSLKNGNVCNFVTKIDLKQDLKPNESMHLICWIHGARVGKHLLQFLFGYSGTKKSKEKMFESPERVTVLSRYLNVEPLIGISLFTRDHFADIKQHILGIELENLQSQMVQYEGIADSVSMTQLIGGNNMSNNVLSNENNFEFENQWYDMNEKKFDALMAANETDIAPILTIRNVSCIAQLWKISKLVRNQNCVALLKGESICSMIFRLLPANSSNRKEDEIDKFRRRRHLVKSTCKFVSYDEKNESEKESSYHSPSMKINVSKHKSVSLQLLDDIVQCKHGLMVNFFKVKQQHYEERLCKIARTFGHLRKRDKNELDIIVSFEINESKSLNGYFNNLDFVNSHDNRYNIGPNSNNYSHSHSRQSSTASSRSVSRSQSNPLPLPLPMPPSSLQTQQTQQNQQITNKNNNNSNNSNDGNDDGKVDNQLPQKLPKLFNTLSDAVSQDENVAQTSESTPKRRINLPSPNMKENENNNNNNNNNSNYYNTNHIYKNKIEIESKVMRSKKILSFLPKILRSRRYGFYMLHQPFVFSQTEIASNCPLRVALKYPKKVSMTNKRESVIVDVTLMVLNTSRSSYVNFVLETLLPNEEFDSISRSFVLNQHASVRSKYLWIDESSYKNVQTELAPGGYTSFELKSQFDEPGIYNLNRYRFAVKSYSIQDKENNIVDLNSLAAKIFFFPTQHLIVVGAL